MPQSQTPSEQTPSGWISGAQKIDIEGDMLPAANKIGDSIEGALAGGWQDLLLAWNIK
jgi:hypothetical protein